MQLARSNSRHSSPVLPEKKESFCSVNVQRTVAAQHIPQRPCGLPDRATPIHFGQTPMGLDDRVPGSARQLRS